MVFAMLYSPLQIFYVCSFLFGSISSYEYNIFTNVGFLSQSTSQSGIGTISAYFGRLLGIVCDLDGNVFTSDYDLNVIHKISSLGDTSIFVGSPQFRSGASNNAIGTFALIDSPHGMVFVPSTKDIYLTSNSKIQKITSRFPFVFLIGRFSFFLVLLNLLVLRFGLKKFDFIDAVKMYK